MAFADPQSVTVNAVAQSMPRTGPGPNSTVYTKEDGSYKLTISHAYGRRTSRRVRLDFAKIAVDPLVPALNAPYDFSVSFVVNHPKVGFTNTELKQVAEGLCAYLTASSGANLVKLFGGES